MYKSKSIQKRDEKSHHEIKTKRIPGLIAPLSANRPPLIRWCILKPFFSHFIWLSFSRLRFSQVGFFLACSLFTLNIGFTLSMSIVCAQDSFSESESEQSNTQHSCYQGALHTETDIESYTKSTAIDCNERIDQGYVDGEAFEISVVSVDGKPVERETANAYWLMKEAAQSDGVVLNISSGFRTYAEQEYFYNCYTQCNCNQCNLAARPGYSNHQSGHALDLNTSQAGVFDWLNQNASRFGFSRTVPSEPWHWEWWGGGLGGGPCTSTPCEVVAREGGVLDDSGPCFSRYGNEMYWRYTETEGVNGSLYWTNAFQADQEANWAQWRIFLETEGHYLVEVSTGQNYGLCTQTQYRVTHAGQQEWITLNQAHPEEWQSLGLFYFEGQGGQSVAVFDHVSGPVAENQHIAADAIRLTPQACHLIEEPITFLDEQGPCFKAYGSSMYWRGVEGQGYNQHLLWTNAHQSNTPSNWGKWTLFFDQAGEYEISVRTGGQWGIWMYTPYRIQHARGETEILIDQSLPQEWQSLGTFSFRQGGGQSVSIFDHTDREVAEDQHIMVDALKIERRSPSNQGQSSLDMGADPSENDLGNQSGLSLDQGWSSFADQGLNYPHEYTRDQGTSGEESGQRGEQQEEQRGENVDGNPNQNPQWNDPNRSNQPLRPFEQRRSVDSGCMSHSSQTPALNHPFFGLLVVFIFMILPTRFRKKKKALLTGV